MIRSMLIVSGAALAVMNTAACTSEVVPKAEELAERACACDTAECAEEINAEVEDFLREATGEKLSESDERRLTAAANQIGTCIAGHIGADALGDEGGIEAEGHSLDPSHDHDGDGEPDH